MAFAYSKGAWSESQNLTRAAPTTSADGIALGGDSGLSVIVEASGANTLSGGGKLDCYEWNGALNAGAGAWSLYPSGVLSIPASASGLARVTLPVLAVIVPRGRICFAANAVTVSAGTTVTVYIVPTSPSLPVADATLS